MKKINSTEKVNQKININDVVVSNLSKSLYDYSNRENEINALVESISSIGQQQPITVVRDGSTYVVLDGVLRLKAVIRLNLNEIDAIVCEFPITDEFSLSDLIIHHQIQKQKTDVEKLNEVRSLLRIDSENKNPLRDKEKRVALISSLLGGKGWGRNNVYSLEKILRWEKKSNSNLSLAEQVISNEISIKKAQDTVHLFENPMFNRKKEKESGIIKGFQKGNYPVEKALKLMEVYGKKKKDGHTVVKLHPVEKGNYTILHGNNEEIQLPDDLEIDTIFTSPPYYKLVKYGDDPNELGWEKTPDLYVKRLADILMKGYEKLKDTGSMFVNLGESYEDSQCFGITERLTVELMGRGVIFVDRLIWNKISNKPVPNNIKRLRPGFETILHFSKTRDYYFENIKIKSDKTLKVTRGCREKNSDKVSYHIQNNYNQFRSVLSDEMVSTVLTIQLNKNRTKHVEGEEEHPATFSSNLPVIPLLISTPKNRDAVVFDPFMGSGSCGVTALMLGFKFVGVELYEKNILTSERVLSEGQDSFDQESLNSLLEDYRPSDEVGDSENLPTKVVKTKKLKQADNFQSICESQDLMMGKRMDSWLKTGSFNKKDEYYTPAIMVYPILEYLQPGSTVWCPFDTENSEFVKVLTAEGFNVIHSHIWEGKDFFEYEPSEPYHYIISNPPFTIKLDVLRRLYQLNKPFAMILGLPILNYQEIGAFFLDKNLELLIFDKKVSFDGNTASFNCSYFCNGILPKDITFYHLPHNNSGKNFISSRMAA